MGVESCYCVISMSLALQPSQFPNGACSNCTCRTIKFQRRRAGICSEIRLTESFPGVSRCLTADLIAGFASVSEGSCGPANFTSINPGDDRER